MIDSPSHTHERSQESHQALVRAAVIMLNSLAARRIDLSSTNLISQNTTHPIQPRSALVHSITTPQKQFYPSLVHVSVRCARVLLLYRIEEASQCFYVVVVVVVALSFVVVALSLWPLRCSHTHAHRRRLTADCQWPHHTTPHAVPASQQPASQPASRQ